MNPSQLGRFLSITMLLLGLGGAIYSAVEWMHAPAASSTKYEILFVMWLVLGIGWGVRLLPNGPRDSLKAHERDRATAQKNEGTPPKTEGNQQ
jgi:hypothetical protein